MAVLFLFFRRKVETHSVTSPVYPGFRGKGAWINFDCRSTSIFLHSIRSKSERVPVWAKSAGTINIQKTEIHPCHDPKSVGIRDQHFSVDTVAGYAQDVFCGEGLGAGHASNTLCCTRIGKCLAAAIDAVISGVSAVGLIYR